MTFLYEWISHVHQHLDTALEKGQFSPSIQAAECSGQLAQDDFDAIFLTGYNMGGNYSLEGVLAK